MMSSDEETAKPLPTSETTSTGPSLSPVATGGDLNSYIGARLRQAFDDIAQQPVPERLLQLMRDLDKK